MRARSASILVWSAVGVAGLLEAVSGWLAALNVGTPLPDGIADLAPENGLFEMPAGLAFLVVGALIVARRPSNRIGLVLFGIGLGGAISGFAGQYAVQALLADPGSLPGGPWAAWLRSVTLALFVPIFVFLPLWFPDGRPPSRRWRPVGWLGAVAMALLVLGSFAPGPLEGFGVETPAGIRGFGAFTGLAWVLMPFVTIGAVVALIVRFRRSRGDERQQMKWFTFAAVVLVAYGWLGDVLLGDERLAVLRQVLLGLVVAALPVAAGIAVLRYRLYDIDVVIRKTVVVGLMAAFISAVYVALVIGVGALVGSGGNAVLSAAAAAIVALAFQPVRLRARRLADRVVYGRRATPYEILSAFSERVGETYASEDVLQRMARMLAEGTGASRAEVWLRSGSELRRASSFPDEGPSATVRVRDDELPPLDGSVAVPVRHQGELLGAVVVTKQPSDPITPAEEALVTDLAAQAGLVLRNAALIEDLRRSRQRIVAAQDEERRRLERNLHDGAQQQLVALAVKLRLVEAQIPADPESAVRMTRDVGSDVGDALDTLRDLARGIYPPLLADRGLGAALEAQARKAAVPVTIDADGVGRYPQEVESALYFSCLEALQNVAKYAEASLATIRLSSNDGLAFEIRDNGRGFDATATSLGTGLQGIVDRVAAIGGTIDVRSSPGGGTTIAGRIPVEPFDPQ